MYTNTQEFINSFDAMSPEDQSTVRTHLFQEVASGPSCCSGKMKETLTDMMKHMEASDDPMAMCHEMMQMCQQKMASKCAS